MVNYMKTTNFSQASVSKNTMYSPCFGPNTPEIPAFSITSSATEYFIFDESLFLRIFWGVIVEIDYVFICNKFKNNLIIEF